MKKFSNFRKKVALLMVEGLGEINTSISSPYLPSNSRSIQNIFDSYRKFTLKTEDSTISDYLLESDPQSLVNTALSSKRALGPFAAFEKDKNLLDDNLEKAIDSSSRHNSSIHILLIYSRNKKLFNRSVLEHTLKKIKDKKAQRAYLHLFIDRGISKSEISSFLEEIKKSNIDLATISGISSIISKNKKDYLMIYKALVFGRARQILSFENIEDGEFGYLLPHIVTKRGKANSLVRDFDVIVYLNNFNELAFEIFYLLNKRTKSFIGDRNIFDLKNYTLTKAQFKLAGNKVKNLLEASLNENNILTILSEYGLNQVLILDKEDRDLMVSVSGKNEVLDGEDLALIDARGNITQSTEYILSTFAKTVKEDRYDFVYAHLTGLRKAAFEYSFKKAIEVIDGIDRKIDKVVKTVEDEGYTLIIASPFSGVESFSETISRSDFNPDSIKVGKVPLVIINELFRKKERSQFLVKGSSLMDIISSRYSIYDLAPTILELFNIEINDQFEGRSLLSEG